MESATRIIFDSAGIGVLTSDEHGAVLSTNQSFRDLVGYSEEELRGMMFRDFVHPEDLPEDLARFARLIRGEVSFYAMEKRYITKDRRIIWVHLTRSLVKSSDGAPYTVALVENITARKHAEENARRFIAERAAREEAENSLTLLNAVLQHMPAGVVILEAPSGQLLLMNRTLSSMAGSDGLPATPENSPLLKKLQRTGLEVAIQRGEVLTQHEESFDRKDGARGMVRIGAAPVLDRDGRRVAAVVTAADVTEARQAEEALRTSEKLATVGRLAATIAHEINNPLEAVTNLLYLLENAPNIPEDSRRLIILSQQELGRVVHIVRQTLGFYRESASPVPVNLSSIVDDVLGLYSRKIRENKITIEREYLDPGKVEALPGEMRQVFSNMIVNAVDAMSKPGEGKLCIRIARSCNWRPPAKPGVRVTIADSGVGITPENRKHIFEPFFSTKGEKGTGLGLWVSSGIVQKHGGSIHLRSRPGRGTCFSIFIPENTLQPAKAA